MHSLSRSTHLPHNRLRWQPYSQLSRCPFIFNTPSISPSQNKICISYLLSISFLSTTHPNPLLIHFSDQAVRTLGDIWPHNDIPSVFLVNSIPSISLTESLSNLFIQPTTNPQLPSPITPSRSPISHFYPHLPSPSCPAPISSP
jgi:hypothetical protein